MRQAILIGVILGFFDMSMIELFTGAWSVSAARAAEDTSSKMVARARKPARESRWRRRS